MSLVVEKIGENKRWELGCCEIIRVKFGKTYQIIGFRCEVFARCYYEQRKGRNGFDIQVIQRKAMHQNDCEKTEGITKCQKPNEN